MTRTPFSQPMKKAAGTAAASTSALLIWTFPNSQHDHIVTWTLFVVSVGGLIAVLGIHLRNTCIAAITATVTASVNTALAHAQQMMREETTPVLAAAAVLRRELAAHDTRVGTLAEAILQYGDERDTRARLEKLVEEQPNGRAPAGGPTALRSVN